MTREECKKVIEVLDDMKVKIDIPKAAKTQNDRNWALDMAIKALSQEPCTDTVSIRKDALKTRVGKIVAYNVEWLKKHWQMEMDIVCGVKPCTDAVSRAELLKAIDTWDKFGCDADTKLVRYQDHYVPYIHYDDVIKCIKGMPSVTQKSGKWIEHPEIETSAPEYLMFYECSECGNKPCFCKSDIHKKRFCSNCGARMESEVDE